MIKNYLKSNIGENLFGDKIELNNITLRWDGRDYVLKPGETVDIMKVFPVNKEEVGLLEARFVQKFSGALRSIDTAAEEARLEEERSKEKIEKVAQAKTVKEVKALISGDKNSKVVNAGIEKIEELSSVGKGKSQTT